MGSLEAIGRHLATTDVLPPTKKPSGWQKTVSATRLLVA